MIDTKGLDEFRAEWDRLSKKDAEPAKLEQPKDTGAVTDMDDFDYGDPVKDTAKATQIAESNAPSEVKTEVKTTPEEVKPKLSFKERFAQARKAGEKTFDWVGKDGKTTKIAVKLKSEIAKPAAKAAPVAKPTVAYKPTPPNVPAITDAAPKIEMVTAPKTGTSPSVKPVPVAAKPEAPARVSNAAASKPSDDETRIAANGNTVDAKGRVVTGAAKTDSSDSNKAKFVNVQLNPNGKGFDMSGNNAQRFMGRDS
jgi:hypothetical protein